MTGAGRSLEPSFAAALAELPHMPRKQLVELWVKHVGRPPPNATSTSLLLRTAAYRVQEQQFGGLKRQDLRLLHKASGPDKVEGNKAPRQTDNKAGRMLLRDEQLESAQSESIGPAQREKLPAKARAIALRPGTRLVREWQGRSHSVEVRADGFGWNGQVYRSLSAVAFAITGARWSGNRFFRL